VRNRLYITSRWYYNDRSVLLTEGLPVMPRCEGLPTGPCPRKVNNRTVKLCQGDLMLCQACENARFPPTTKGESAKSSRSSSTSKVRASSSCDSEGEHPPTYCNVCKDDSSLPVIQCDICSAQVHCHCAGIDSETAELFLTIVAVTRWVCSDCRGNIRNKFEQLQSALADITEKMCDMSNKLAAHDRLLKCTEKQPAIIRTSDDVNDDRNHKRVSEVAFEVHRTITDIARRKCNIVVTGLSEPTDEDENSSSDTDRTTFLKLCEENFSVKPSVSRLGCHRLGRKINNSQPRKLLVHLDSENAARDLLREAPKLRKSRDTAGIYINKDLTPAEAALAFQRREKRRRNPVQQTAEVHPVHNRVAETSRAPELDDSLSDITYRDRGSSNPNCQLSLNNNTDTRNNDNSATPPPPAGSSFHHA